MSNRQKVKANANQLSLLRQQMVLNQDMGQTNLHVDQRWAALKLKLDGLGVIRSLEQWKKSWKDREKNVFGSTNLQPLNQGGASPSTILAPSAASSSTTVIGAAATVSATDALNTITVNQPLGPIMNNEEKPVPVVSATPLPTHLFSMPVMKTDTFPSDDDDDIKYVGYSLALKPPSTSSSSNKESVRMVDDAPPSTSNNESSRRGIKRSFQAENTTLAAMHEHNEIMKILQEAAASLAQQISAANENNQDFQVKVLSLLTDIELESLTYTCNT